ncbi:pantetheinase-like [Macrobrachium rosenbergii]|uniref:pantetheinase-like n=1 Tax=Macrobrachium rosenbergii TaxID=79674 RepID=UPI0034D50D3F
MTLSFSYIIIYLCLSCLVAARQDDGKTGREQKYDFQSTLKAHRKGETAKEFVHKDTTVEVEVEYVAAALQYDPYDDLSAGGLAVLEENARTFIHYAGEAKDMGAQIIVFPEYGLTSLNLDLTLGTFLAQTQVVPNPEDKEVPCEYGDVKNSSKIMKELSCAAMESGIYLVVDLAEQSNCSGIAFGEEDLPFSQNGEASGVLSGCIFYNSQVVFDDAGAVVARYRKKHLFLEPVFTPGTDPDSTAVFETSFGVTFTLLICFDILYESPAVSNIYNLGVRDALLSTAWIDGLPSLSAPQVWKGFSQGNNVNLVAANIYAPPGGFLGAGIFRGVYSEPEYYTYDTSSGTKLIVGKVKTKSAAPSAKRHQPGDSEVFSYKAFDDLPLLGPAQMEKRQTNAMELMVNGKKIHKQSTNQNMKQKYLHEDLSRYNHTILERTSPGVFAFQELCHVDNLCCNLTYEYPAEEPEDIVYMLIAYSGIEERGEVVYLQYVQVCGVILCLNETIDSCGYFEEAYVPESAFRAYSLSGTFSDRYIYPSVFTDALQLFGAEKWNYTLSESPDHYHAIIHLHEEVNDLSMLSLFSRWFSRDPNH